MNLLEILKKNADNAKSYIDGLVSKKQDTLTFDTAPTKGSQNPVTSDGIQKAIAAKTVDLSNYPTKDGIGATGNWSINAATATKLATPRTIALTGKVAGSATFDGSTNMSINVTSVNADTASKLSTARKINITGNASGAATFDGSGDININTTVNESKHAAAADNVVGIYVGSSGDGGKRGPDFFGKKRAGCLMSNQPVNEHNEYKNWLYMDNYDGNDVGGATAIGVSRTETRAYIMGSNADRKQWDRSAELLSSANYNLFAPTKTGGGASGTWGISITGNANTATTASSVPWDGVTGKPGTYPPSAHNHDSAYPSVTGTRASGTWGINISGNAASATNADKLDGYHASDLLSKAQGILPKTAAEVGQFRELVVNDSHQIKLPDGGTWAYFVYTYNSWSGDHSNGEHRTRTGAGIAAGGTVLHTDIRIDSNTINAFRLSGTAVAGAADGNNIIVGGFCWRIA